MGKLDIKINKNGSKYDVVLTGTVDEDIDFSQHSLSGAGEVEMMLKDVKSINSCGIREWIKWIGTAVGAQIVYKECPKIIVDQINMVEGFLPAGGKVQSFYVPYYNEESGDEKMILFTAGKEFTDGSVNPPQDVKDSGGNAMEMDVLEAKYFKFLKK